MVDRPPEPRPEPANAQTISTVPAADREAEGEMSARLRALDWAGTPLGPREAWPPVLRGAVELLLGAEVAMLVWWGAERIALFNDAARPLLERGRGPEALGQPARNCWPALEPALAGVMASGRPARADDLPVPLEGSSQARERYFSLVHSPIRDEGGPVVGVLTQAFETTAGVLAERRLAAVLAEALDRDAQVALRRSEERYRQLVELSPDAILIRRDEQIEFINSAGVRLYGAERAEQLLGRSMLDFVTPEDRPAAAERIQALFAGLPVVHAEQTMTRLDGRVIIAEVVAAPLSYSGQRLAQVILRDVTASRQAEAALRQARDAARAAAARLARLQAVTAALARGLSIAEVAELIVQQCAGAMQASAAGVYLAEDDGRHLRLAADLRFSEVQRRRFERVPVEAHLPVCDVYLSREALWVESYDALVRGYPGVAPPPSTPHNEALAVVPLLVEQRALGVLTVSFATQRRFAPEERTFLLTLAQQCSQAMERAQLFDAERRMRTAQEQAREALQESHSLLQAVIEGSTDGIFLRDRRGRHQLVNTAGARSHGLTPADMLGKTNAEALGPDLAATIDAEDRRVLESGRALSFEHEATVDGALRVYHTVKAPYRDAQGRVAGVIGVSRDITSLRRAEQAQRFLAQVGMAISASLDVQAILDVVARLPVPELADYCIVRLFDEHGRSRAMAHAHARPEQAAQLAAFAAHAPDWLIDGRSRLAQAIRAGQPQISPSLSPEAAEEWSSPEARRLLAGLAPCSRLLVPLPSRRGPLGVLALLFSDSGRHYGEADLALAEALAQRAGLAIDNALLFAEAQTLNQALEARVLERTAELERSQAQLRQLSARLEALREEERARLAREVHDELGGFLTAIKMDIVRLGKTSPENASLYAERLDRLQHSIDETVQTVRRIATELRPALLDDFGLVAAIEWQLGEFEKRSGLHCELHAPPDGVALAGDGATAVFRVFQETLTNIARHAGASAVDVTLQADGGRLTLEVRDNGVGIDPERLQGARSLGLLGMRERIRLLSGELDIQGQPGAGTVVRVTVPMEG